MGDFAATDRVSPRPLEEPLRLGYAAHHARRSAFAPGHAAAAWISANRSKRMNRDENPNRPPALLSNDTPVSPSGRDLVARGRLLYFGIVLFVLFIEIPLTLTMGSEPNSELIALSLALFIAGWRGHGWAIALLGVGFVFGVLIGLIDTFEVASISGPPRCWCVRNHGGLCWHRVGVRPFGSPRCVLQTPVASAKADARRDAARPGARAG